MGKRLNSVLVFIAVATVLATNLTTSRISASGFLGALYGVKTSAQEVNPDRSMASDSNTKNDSVVERNSISEPSKSKQIKITVTAYTNDPAETKDYAIGITAMGTHTRDGVAAANFLPFGTKFQLPEIYGDKIFTIEDRMNVKYNSQKRVDIWMLEKSQAFYFGKKTTVMQLL